MKSNILSNLTSKIAFSMLVFAALGLSASESVAKDRIARSQGHEREFVAISHDLGEYERGVGHHSSCFMSSTPAEVARGIRHWSGSC